MIVVTTPTGQIGSQVLRRVVDAGEPVRVLVRDAARLPAEVRGHVEVVEGSMGDDRAVTAALTGADAVFWLVPPDPQAASVQRHALDFLRPLCTALNETGVERIVAVSSLGRGTATNAGQISAIFAMDDLIESTGVHYRSLALPGFMENLLWQVEPIKHQGAFFLPVAGDRRVPSCATRDVAAVAAGLLLDSSWRGQERVPVVGPEDLSQNEMAAIMAEVLDRPIRFQPIPGEAYRESLVDHGMAEAWARGLVAMAAAVDRGIYDAEARPAVTAPTSFRTWCEEVLKPAVLA